MADGGRSSEGPVPMQGPGQDYGPLPNFVLNWGNSVQRPPSLPEKYDNRIDPAFIFAFPFDPFTGAEGWFYVVPKGCTHCQKLKQRCNRGSPCERCSRSNKNCVRVGEKWDELPGIKISKSGNTKLTMDSFRPNRAAPHSAPPVPRVAGGRALRSQKETPSYAEAQISSPEAPLRLKTHSKKRVPLDDPFVFHFQKKPRTQLHEKPKFRRGPKRVVSAPVPQIINFSAPIDIQLEDDARQPRWEVPSNGVNGSSPTSIRDQVIGTPWAWSRAKSDLLEVIPELSRAVNGVLWMFAETPVLILEEGKPLDDPWDGGDVFVISMVRELLEPEQGRDAVLPSQPQGDARVTLDPGTRADAEVSLDPVNPSMDSTDNNLYSPTVAVPDPPGVTLRWQPVIYQTTPAPSAFPHEPPPNENLSFDLRHRLPFCDPPLSSQPVIAPRVSSGLTGAFGFVPSELSSNDPSFALNMWPGRVADTRASYSDVTFVVSPGAQEDRWTQEMDSVSHMASSPRVDSQETQDLPSSPSVCLAEIVRRRADDGHEANIDAALGDETLHKEASGDSFQRDTFDKGPTESPSPPEIRALLDFHRALVPVNILVHKDSQYLPFDLPEGCEYAFLGYFTIKDVERTAEGTRDRPDRGSISTFKWKFTLEWASDGELQARYPWWMAGCANQSEIPRSPEGYTPIPSHVMRSQPNRDPNHPYETVEQYTRKGWHCLSCGRINVQTSFCFQRCSTCSAGNDAPPVEALYIRNPYTMDTTHSPTDRYPPKVTCQMHRVQDGMRLFTYQTSPSASVKHFFTCNQPDLQAQPTILFHDIQARIEIPWQSVKTPIAAGPYFSCAVEVGTRADTPDPLSALRGLMEGLVSGSSTTQTLTLDELTILAWHGVGHRKSPPLFAKEKSIAMLCLGADVELVFKLEPAGSLKSRNNRSNPRGVHVVHTPLLFHSEDEEDEFMDEDEPVTGLFDIERSVSMSGPPKSVPKKAKKNDNVLFITLVHGDMVLLAGDDFEWSLRRTGMSILAVGVFTQSPKLP